MKNHIALISDIHGNIDALEAALADITRRGVEKIYNLGDHFLGPLDPIAVFELISSNKNIISLMGNGDRLLLQEPDDSSSLAVNNLRRTMPPHMRSWIMELKKELYVEPFYFCHGNPRSDEEYFLEDVFNKRLRTRSELLELSSRLDKNVQLLACGHSHLPRLYAIDDSRLLVNPGSVGLAAYCDEFPVKHKMESASPHAKYAIAEKIDGRWHVDFLCVPYNWEKAAALALKNNRSDWASYISSGLCPS